MSKRSLLGTLFSADGGRLHEPAKPHEISQGRYMRRIASVTKTGACVSALHLSCGHSVVCGVDPDTLRGWTYCPDCLRAGVV